MRKVDIVVRFRDLHTIMAVDLSSESITETDVNTFCVEMMKRLDIQRRNEQFCDVILEVGSGDDQARLKAHRIVLCAAKSVLLQRSQQ